MRSHRSTWLSSRRRPGRAIRGVSRQGGRRWRRVLPTCGRPAGGAPDTRSCPPATRRFRPARTAASRNANACGVTLPCSTSPSSRSARSKPAGVDLEEAASKLLADQARRSLTLMHPVVTRVVLPWRRTKECLYGQHGGACEPLLYGWIARRLNQASPTVPQHPSRGATAGNSRFPGDLKVRLTGRQRRRPASLGAVHRAARATPSATG